MTSIQYLNGDATRPQGEGLKIIVHVCNDVGGWGKGFVLALSNRWAEPEADYRRWYVGRAANDFALGAVQFVQVEPDVVVANMIGQRDITASSEGPPIRYDAIKNALGRVADHAGDLDASVHMPRIGCGLAGGQWERVEPLIEATLCAANVCVFVYDFG